jgi:hypothetical protein
LDEFGNIEKCNAKRMQCRKHAIREGFWDELYSELLYDIFGIVPDPKQIQRTDKSPQ